MIKVSIKQERERLGISQRELARRIHMSGQMISKIERGETTPSIETLVKIGSVLNVPIHRFFEYDEYNYLLFGEDVKTLEDVRLHIVSLTNSIIKYYEILNGREIISDEINALNDSIETLCYSFLFKDQLDAIINSQVDTELNIQNIDKKKTHKDK